MSNLIKRLLTGIIYVALIVVSLLFTHWAFPLLCTLFGILGLMEFDRLTSGLGTKSATANVVDLVFGALILASMAVYGTPMTALLLFLLYILVRLTVQLYLHSSTPIADTAKSALSFVWIIVPLLALEVAFAFNRYVVLSMFIMIWLNDTGAYCSGSLMGRHKMWERISPKKTWEGLAGGFLFSAVFGWFAPMIPFLHIPLSPLQSLLMGIIVSVAATYGDLAESLFKRALHAKDSGHLLPGHGGILDRIDSLLFAAPAVVLFIFLLVIQ